MHLREKLSLILDAIRGDWNGYYPHENGCTTEAPDIVKRIYGKLNNINCSGSQSEEYLKLGRESLDEVKSLTEYQDGKTSRLLTIIAFLTAAAGVVFSKILDVYPLRQVFRLEPLYQGILVGFVYLFFALFLIFVALGSLVSFHAMRTRFFWKNDKSKDESQDATYDHVKSFLFFQNIVRTKPEAWAEAFVDPANQMQPNPDLPGQYYKNYIAESYLVAAKLGDKLRYLEPAQDLLLWSIKVLIFWILLLAFAVIFVPTSEHLYSANVEKTYISQSGSPAIKDPYISLNEIPASGVIAPASAVVALGAPPKNATNKHASCKVPCVDPTQEHK